jgi:hypothetical protein
MFGYTRLIRTPVHNWKEHLNEEDCGNTTNAFICIYNGENQKEPARLKTRKGGLGKTS